MKYIVLLFVFNSIASNTVYDGDNIPNIKPSDANQLQSDGFKADSNLSTSAHALYPTNITPKNEAENAFASCPSGVHCSILGGECINCEFNKSCIYGSDINVSCEVKSGIKCEGDRRFSRSMICRYCYQTEKWEHFCRGLRQCRVASAPRERFVANCTVKSEIICLGRRQFSKNLLCNWTSGYRWSTTLILSITLGGFGGDRFYLGHWQEGIGKLFSFGGLGVWTIVDVILVAIGYLKPADGSLYIW